MPTLCFAGHPKPLLAQASLGILLTPCPCLGQQQLLHSLCLRQGKRMGEVFFLASGSCFVPGLVPCASTSSGSILGLLSS